MCCYSTMTLQTQMRVLPLSIVFWFSWMSKCLSLGLTIVSLNCRTCSIQPQKLRILMGFVWDQFVEAFDTLITYSSTHFASVAINVVLSHKTRRPNSQRWQYLNWRHHLRSLAWTQNGCGEPSIKYIFRYCGLVSNKDRVGFGGNRWI